MSLFRRTLLLVILIGSIVLASLIVISDVIITKQFTELERESITKDIGRLNDTIGAELSSLLSKNGDWSNWDDLYAFTQDLNPQFLKVNQTDNSFVQLEISIVLIYNQNGQLIHSKAVDTEIEQSYPVPETLPTKFAPYIFASNEIDGSREMVINDQGKLYLATGRPILDSSGEGPNHGTLFFIKEADDVLVSKFADITHNDTTVYVLPTTDVSSDIQTALINDSDGMLSVPLNDKYIEGYLLSTDAEEDPVAIWKITRERLIVAQGKKTVYTFVVILVFTSLIYGFVILSTLYGLVLKRLLNTVKAADELDSQDTKSRLPVDGNDEITTVTKAINRLLDRLDKTLEASNSSKTEIEKRNKELEAINESMINREIKMTELKDEIKKLKGDQK